MTLDSTFQPLAVTLISKFGKSLTLKHSADGAYDNTTSRNTVVVTNVAVKGVVEEYADNIRNTFGARFGVDSLIAQAEKKVTIAAKGLTVTPRIGDAIAIDGVDYVAVLVAAVYSGELVAIYELSVKKA